MKTTTLEFDLTLYEWELIIYALRSYSAHNRELRERVDALCKYIDERCTALIDFHKIPRIRTQANADQPVSRRET